MSAKSPCLAYQAFGTCKYGAKLCPKSHEGECRSDYFQDIIVSVVKDGVVLTKNPGTTYAVSDDAWHLNGAEKNDLVLFQASTKKKGRWPLGRVVAVLKKNSSIKIKNFQQVKDAFCYVGGGGAKSTFAFSIEACLDKRHRGCKRIGLHVTAATINHLEKVEYRMLAFVPGRVQIAIRRIMEGENKRHYCFHSFQDGKDSLAISVYVHSQGQKDPSQIPAITHIKDVKHFTNDNCTGSDFDLLSAIFIGQDSWKSVLEGKSWKYLVSSPKRHQPLILLDEAKRYYSTVVKSYLRTPNPHVITKRSLKHDDSHSPDEVIVSQEIYDDLAEYLQGIAPKESGIETACFLVAGVRQLQRGFQSPLFVEHTVYQRDVEQARGIGEEGKVVCTAPPGKFDHFINQQILVRSLLGMSAEIYSLQDLLGILGIRFRTPRLVDVYVQDLAATSFRVGYEDITGVDPSICEISYSELGGETSPVEQDERKPRLVKVVWENVKCDTPHHKKLAYLKPDVYKEFREELEMGTIQPRKAKTMVSEMKEGESECPYSGASNATDTQLLLKRGIYIQLQISREDSKMRQGIGLRILRIGAGCHICLTHINHPEKAFISDRTDIKPLLKKPPQTKAHGAEVIAAITWTGDYLSGGTFTSDEKLETGDFLCIRRETEGDDGALYVWNAHAVVAKTNDGKVIFSVCTLSQQEPIKNGDFVIEILKHEDEIMTLSNLKI